MTSEETKQIRIKPGELRAQSIKAHQDGDLDKAFVGYRALLARFPSDAGLWTNLGALFRKQGDHRAAVTCQRRAHQIAPEDTSILNNMANACYDADLLEEAFELRTDLAARSPDNAHAQAMKLVSLRSLNHYKTCVEQADRALMDAPTDAELHVQRAMALLALGRYREGFAAFTTRWDIGEIERPKLKEPEWDGSNPTGSTLIVLPEQGFGDTMLMARFLPLLQAAGPRVILGVKQPLARLFAGIAGQDQIVEIGSKKPAFDAYCPMMDLPRFVEFDDAAIPPPPALSIPQDSRERALKITGPFKDMFKVGIVWSGSVTYRANHKRSVGPRSFIDLADTPGVQLFSLYKGPQHKEFLENADSGFIVDASGDDRDFADAAALVEALDLVITIDSAVAHLAGTLGRPVWNMLAYSPYWLYGGSGERTQWYPSMRLFRQSEPGRWDSVFAEVKAELQREVSAWRKVRGELQ